MKCFKLILLVLSLTFGYGPVFAQKNHGDNHNKLEWMAKMRKVKHDFLSKELQLTDAQKKEFFEIYDRNESARRRIEHDMRQREKAVEQKGDAATDAELDSIIANQFSIEERLGAVDRSFLPQFRKVLTRRQLARLKHAERKFNRKLMEQRNSAKCPPPSKKNK